MRGSIATRFASSSRTLPDSTPVTLTA